MLRWWIYLKERSPLAVLVLLALGPVVSGYMFTAKQGMCAQFQSCLDSRTIVLAGIVAVFSSVLFMIAARMMDEIKDFEKDKLANPTRPLPRGLISVSEMCTGIRVVMLILVALGFSLLALVSTLAGSLFLFSSLYLWFMYKEFYVGQKLANFPLIYAFSHQIVGVPLYLFGVTLFVPQFVQDRLAWIFVGLNLCASISYEFSRKLKPNAHPAAQTYRQIYGLKRASSVALLFQGAALALTLLGHPDFPGMAVLALVQFPTVVLILLHSLRDRLHKPVEALAAISVLGTAWMGVLMVLKI